MDFPFEKNITLENDRARLEPLEESIHLKPLLSISESQPNLLQYSPSPFGEAEKLKENFAIARKNLEEKTRYAFAIFDKKENNYAGSTSFGNISNKNQRMEIGWTWLGKSFQGTGLNKNCKYLLLTYAFTRLKCERVELKTDDRNEQSKKAIGKIGAKYEGTLRRNTLMLDGFWRSTAYYSILKSEWKSVQETNFKEFLPVK